MANGPSLYEKRLSSERQEIRVLTLGRGTVDNPVIHCSLTTVSLHDHPTYTALSYVWGNPKERLPIQIGDITFSATKNLAQALRFIRNADQDMCLWVDAVCINQDDIDERNSQVALMGTLYSEATDVIIWLGEPDPTTDELADIVEEAGLPDVPESTSENYVEAYLEYAVRFTRLLSLFDIVALRHWWSRVWTVQECVLPRRDPIFQCGKRTFGWENFYNIFFETYHRAQGGLNSVQGHESDPRTKEVRRLKQELGKGISQRELLQKVQAVSMLGTVREHFKTNQKIPLASCIAPCLERQATVPHDYIYGFLGLAASEERDQIEIDYRRPHQAVYREFFELIMNIAGPDEMRILTMLSFYTDSEERPSWLPDFSSQRDVARYTGYFLASETCFRTLEEVWWSDDDEILMLQGVHLDVIQNLYPMQEEQDDWAKHMFGLARLVREHQNNVKGSTNINCDPPFEIINASRTIHISHLFLGSIQMGDNLNMNAATIASTWDTIAAYLNAGGVLINFDRDEFKLPRPDLGGISLLTFIICITIQTFVVCRGRSAMLSRAGLLGVCVPNARQGDEIVCLYGFHMPLILRPMRGHYRIVGGVHIPGMMDWARLDRCLENGELREATFCIR